MVNCYPDTGTQGTSAGDNDAIPIISFSITYGEVYETASRDLEWIYIEPKKPCFTERGHNWWYYDLFLPIPEKDLNIRRVSCGNHSPPGLVKGCTNESGII